MPRGVALLALFSALAVLHTWPLASDLAGLSRLDNDDTGLNVWVIAWVADVLPRDPLGLFDAPMFFPEARTLAYSEHMLVPALMGAPLRWVGSDPVFVYNVLVLAGFTLSGWSMCLLVRHWTGSTAAGIVSGMLFAFNAHLLTRLPHLQALHVQFVPAALYALDRILSAGPRRDAHDRGTHLPAASAALAGAFVLQALCSNYTMVFLGAALVVAVGARLPELGGTGGRQRRLALLGAAALAALALFPFLWPYYLVSRDQGLVRSIDEVSLYSAGWRDYLTTGGRLHYDWWSYRVFEGRTALFPGVTAAMLAASALASRGTWRDPRVRMVLAMGATGAALSFGPSLPGYAWLHEHVALLQGIRAAARWGFLFLVAVAILAGCGVARLERRLGGSPYWPALVLGIIGLVTLEALRAPMGLTLAPRVPAIYDALGAAEGTVLVELPLYAGERVSENARYLLPNTRSFRPLVNGYSGFESETFRQRAVRWRDFPAGPVADEMVALGVTHVMLHRRDLDAAQVQAAAASPRLDLIADDGERRLYRVR